MREKLRFLNKILTLTSIFSMAILFNAFSVNAANDNSNTGENKKNPVPIINANQMQYEETENDTAILANKKDELRIRANRQDFCFTGNTNNCINCGEVDDPSKGCAGIEGYTNETLRYVLPNNAKIETSYVEGNPTIITEKEGYYRFWRDPQNIEANFKIKSSQGEYSSALPKICYTGFSDTEKGLAPLTELFKSSKAKYTDDQTMILPLKSSLNCNDLKSSGFYGEPITSASVVNFKKTDENCLDPIFEGADELTLCQDPKYTNRNTIGGNKGADCSVRKQNCEGGSDYNCHETQVKLYFKDSEHKDTYKSGYCAIVDIPGNNRKLSLPLESCFICRNISPDYPDSDCQTIVKNVYNAVGGNCAEAVRVLATNPRNVVETAPADLQGPYNCQNCLTKVEGILRGFGCK
ncbi:MAG: hypothetical protein ACI4N3_03690 [Alphaproteobacteria bacterium]